MVNDFNYYIISGDIFGFIKLFNFDSCEFTSNIDKAYHFKNKQDIFFIIDKLITNDNYNTDDFNIIRYYTIKKSEEKYINLLRRNKIKKLINKNG